jgi:hypothetical protein
VIQPREAVLEAKKGVSVTYAGSIGSLGKAAVFRRTPPDNTQDEGVIVFFGDTILTKDSVSLETQDVSATLSDIENTLCADTRPTALAEFGASGYLAGFPDCRVQVGPWVFNCEFWSYILVSEASKDTLNKVRRTRVNHLNPPDPSLSPATLNHLQNIRRENQRVPMVCRAARFPILRENMDVYLLEASDLLGLCPVLMLRQTYPPFEDFILDRVTMATDLTTLLGTLPYIAALPQKTQPEKDAVAKIIADLAASIHARMNALAPGRGTFGVPYALVNPGSEWSKDVMFLDYFLDRGVLYPTSAFAQADIESTLNFKIDLFQLNLPKLRLPHPNSADFDKQNVWREEWNELLIEETEDIHPQSWAANLTNTQLRLCQDIFERTQFTDPDRRSDQSTQRAPITP